MGREHLSEVTRVAERFGYVLFDNDAKKELENLPASRGAGP